jgi:DNA-binding CsgD family transcriptional regulator
MLYQHLMVLDIVFLLFVGLWAVFRLKNLYRKYYYPYLKYIFEYTFFLNLFILWLLIILYIIVNLPKNYIQNTYPRLLELNEFVVLMIQFGLAISVYKALVAFREKKISPALHKVFYCAMAAITASYIVKLFISKGAIFFRIIDRTQYFIFDNLLALDVVILMIIFWYGKKSAEKNRKRLMESFSLLFLSKYLPLFSVPLLVLLFPSIKKPMRLLIVSLPLFWINLVPFAWIKWFFLRYVSQLKITGNQEINLDHFCERYGLSKREREILELLLKGKGNRDIEDLLFISYHTVKNHVSNIYGKLGIKSRNDLANLVSGFH